MKEIIEQQTKEIIVRLLIKIREEDHMKYQSMITDTKLLNLAVQLYQMDVANNTFKTLRIKNITTGDYLTWIKEAVASIEKEYEKKS